jgi:hypothetical protein
MNLSEQEAREKWCPYQQMTYQMYSVKGTSEFMSCCASTCIMWRWEEDTSYTGKITGYCGLGGKP